MVCCHGSEYQGEWLLDVVWANRNTWEIALAVESEWGRLPAIQEDFGKLMSVKSRPKLLLFSTYNHEGAKGIVSELEKMMLALSNADVPAILLSPSEIVPMQHCYRAVEQAGKGGCA